MTQSKRYTRLGLIAVVAILALTAAGSGGAAAVDPADVDVSIDNATDIDASPLPADHPTRALIIVELTAVGTLNPSDVNFSSTAVDKSDPFPPEILGDVAASDIPDSGLNVTVSVSGTEVKTVTLHKKALDSDSATVSSSTLTSADNISLTVDGSDVDESDYLTTVGQTYDISLAKNASSRPITISLEKSSDVINTSVQTANLDYYSGLSDVSGNQTQIYFSDSVREIEIDGESIYQQTQDDPLGGGGGDGSSDNQTLILVAIGLLAAAFVFTRD